MEKTKLIGPVSEETHREFFGWKIQFRVRNADQTMKKLFEIAKEKGIMVGDKEDGEKRRD